MSGAWSSGISDIRVFTGRSHPALAQKICDYLGLPLIQLDVGSLVTKWVGESERNA